MDSPYRIERSPTSTNGYTTVLEYAIVSTADGTVARCYKVDIAARIVDLLNADERAKADAKKK
jgi:hypothetical protein